MREKVKLSRKSNIMKHKSKSRDEKSTFDIRVKSFIVKSIFGKKNQNMRRGRTFEVKSPNFDIKVKF